MRAYYKALDELNPLLKVWVRREIAQDARVKKWITARGNRIPLDKNGKPISGVGKKIFGQEKKQAKQDISSLLTITAD